MDILWEATWSQHHFKCALFTITHSACFFYKTCSSHLRLDTIFFLCILLAWTWTIPARCNYAHELISWANPTLTPLQPHTCPISLPPPSLCTCILKHVFIRSLWTPTPFMWVHAMSPLWLHARHLLRFLQPTHHLISQCPHLSHLFLCFWHIFVLGKNLWHVAIFLWFIIFVLFWSAFVKRSLA